jgi:hypothetical protein
MLRLVTTLEVQQLAAHLTFIPDERTAPWTGEERSSGSKLSVQQSGVEEATQAGVCTRPEIWVWLEGHNSHMFTPAHQ